MKPTRNQKSPPLTETPRTLCCDAQIVTFLPIFLRALASDRFLVFFVRFPPSLLSFTLLFFSFLFLFLLPRFPSRPRSWLPFSIFLLSTSVSVSVSLFFSPLSGSAYLSLSLCFYLLLSLFPFPSPSPTTPLHFLSLSSFFPNSPTPSPPHKLRNAPPPSQIQAMEKGPAAAPGTSPSSLPRLRALRGPAATLGDDPWRRLPLL